MPARAEPLPSAAATPRIYLKVAGYRAAVDFSPPGTLVTSDCTTYCGFSFPLGTSLVTATARPAAGTSFVGWTQAFNGWTPPCTGNAPSCTINLASSVAVKAAFSPVSLSWHEPNGWGWVEFLGSQPACGDTCRLYPYDGVAHVLAHPNDGYAFDGWSGICTSGPACNPRTNTNGILTPRFHCTADACSIGQPYSDPTKVTVQVYGRGKVIGSRINC